MDVRSVKYVADACAGAQLTGSPETLVKGVCTDSREVRPGDLFVAIRGDRFDGHNFLAEAARKGAVALMVSRGSIGTVNGCSVIAVDDTRSGLGRLAAAYRRDFSLPVTAVAGSNGKTTTKELIASVLKQKWVALWSQGSFNNDIGVPLTLLRLTTTHAAAVVELGTNHPGELAPLVKMAKPEYGVITCIGREHLEFFGDVAGVAQEEGTLAEMLPDTGVLLLQGEDAWTDQISRRTRATVVRLGFAEGNNWRARSCRADAQGVSFRVEAPVADWCGEYRIHLLGRHQVVNALFAIALGQRLGMDHSAVQRGLLECTGPKMRLQLWDLNGVRVLDDAYNANADSMIAALQTLKDLPCKGRRLAVLGDMAELGAHSHAAHEEIGRRAAELGVGQLFAVGAMAPVVAQAARRAGLNRVFEFADAESAAAAVKSFIRSGDLLLLKASRASRLERIGELLRKN